MFNAIYFVSCYGCQEVFWTHTWIYTKQHGDAIIITKSRFKSWTHTHTVGLWKCEIHDTKCSIMCIYNFFNNFFNMYWKYIQTFHSFLKRHFVVSNSRSTKKNLKNISVNIYMYLQNQKVCATFKNRIMLSADPDSAVSDHHLHCLLNENMKEHEGSWNELDTP